MQTSGNSSSTPCLPSSQVFHLSQAKQDVAASLLVRHQHRRQQRLHPVQNVRCLPREEVQPGTVRRETCQGAAGPGGHITSPLRLLAQGCQGQGRSLSPACPLEGPCVVRGLLSAISHTKGGGVPEPDTGDRMGHDLGRCLSGTSGPCSAFQSLKDHDGLRPGKLTKQTTRCHPSAPGTWVPRTFP